MGRDQVSSVDCILVVNSGSSSLKFAIYAIENREILCRGSIDWSINADEHTLVLKSNRNAGTSVAGSSIIARDTRMAVDVTSHGDAVRVAIRTMTEWMQVQFAIGIKVIAVGHRIVHGGTHFTKSVLVDSSVRKAILDLAPMAPLHNPSAHEAIVAAETSLPGIPQVAVFDTAFFATLPEKSFVYPLPYEWYSEWGIRRFGFHGISHAYCAVRATEILGRGYEGLRLVVCHLGNGCSASAIAGGRPIATSMGFTPLDGLVMGTRPGSIDPGIMVAAVREHGLSMDAVDQVMNRGSGLLGISGISSDVKKLEIAAAAGNLRAGLALAIFCDRVRSTIGGLAVTLGGVDAVVFTAGIGENSSQQRATICHGLNCIGLHLDDHLNTTAKPDVDIATQLSPARILVIETQEDLMIAREVSQIVTKPLPP